MGDLLSKGVLLIPLRHVSVWLPEEGGLTSGVPSSLPSFGMPSVGSWGEFVQHFKERLCAPAA